MLKKISILLSILFVAAKCEDENPSIIIIGAGPSGIAAATKLLKNNFTNLKILEAEYRIGGRIYSMKVDDGYLDLGAQFCHGQEGNVVYDMVKDLNVLKHGEEEVSMLYSTGDDVDETVQEALWNFLKHFVEDGLADDKECEKFTSVGECFDLKYKTFLEKDWNSKQKPIIEASKSFLINSIDSFDSNFDLNDLLLNTSFKDTPGDIQMNWNGHGYKTILEVMMQKFPNNDHQLLIDDKIFLGKKVTRISTKDGDKVKVKCNDGTDFEADHVIFTPSLGVLKASHEKIFDPVLPPQKIEAIKSIGFGSIVKIFLHFPEELNITTYAAFVWSQPDLDEAKKQNLGWLENLVGVTRGENNSKVLVGWYGGENVTHIETVSNNDIQKGQIYVTEKFLKHKYNCSLPDHFLRTHWYSNPNFRGTYSYESVKGHSHGSNFREELSKPLFNGDEKPLVLFAGEATHPHYYSTVHGAIESGYREADRLINLYKTKSS